MAAQQNQSWATRGAADDYDRDWDDETSNDPYSVVTPAAHGPSAMVRAHPPLGSVSVSETTPASSHQSSAPLMVDEKVIHSHSSSVFNIENPPRPFDIEITGHHTQETGKKHTVFVILVKWPHAASQKPISWIVERRYNEFHVMHKKLAAKISELPALPGKTWMRSFKDDFLRNRRMLLNQYLQEMLEIPVVLHSADFQNFLQAPEKVDMPPVDLPFKDITLAENFGVNGIFYSLESQLVFTVSEDANLLSRLDAQFSNIKFPWEKEDPPITPVGWFSCWRRVGDKWENFAEQAFQFQATAVAWDPLRKWAFIGLENGQIQVFSIDSDSKEVVHQRDYDVHAARVSAIVYDKINDRLITCGRDKQLAVVDVKQSSLLASVVYDKAWLSSMSYDSKTEMAFVGTYDRKVLIFDCSKAVPEIAHTLAGHKGSVRSVWYDSASRTLFSGGFDHVVGVWTIGDPLYRSRSVHWLKGGPPAKVKALTYCPANNQVIAGHENGKVAIWDAAKGKLLYVFDAHKKQVLGAQYFPRLGTLLTCSHDGEVQFWNYPSSQVVANDTL
jgi:WD40 repeat protein